MKNPNPLSELLHSRKFLVLVMDVVVSGVLYFGAKYAGPGTYDDIRFVIGLLQPVFLMLIYAIASENNAQTQAQANGHRSSNH